ncbi:hypothetical protein [uncultured Nocardioides sp.]|uniref:hypothetical protein n=1 Tax=uncultured Nocardioides sp. TaxID=198441 RepID=UPI0026244297|nr:hypothetical protein [uncultured Nocardioides sp.]
MSRRTPRGGVGAVAAVPLLLGLLAGCSSDPYETYCQRVEEHQPALGEAVAAGGPDALLDVLPQLRDLRDAAPRDVADEWQQVVGRLEALDEALDEAGVDPADYDREDPPEGLDPALRTAVDAAARELVRPETAQAMASLETQARDVCQTPLYR